MRRSFKSLPDLVNEASWAAFWLQAICAVLLGALVLLFLLTTRQFAELQRPVSEDAVWAVSQLDRETRKLSADMHSVMVENGFDNERLRQTCLKFDIVYSRLSLLQTGSFDQYLNDDMFSMELIARIIRRTQDLTEMFDGVDEGGVAEGDEFAAATRQVDTVLGEIETLSARVMVKAGEARTDGRRKMTRLQVLSGLVGCMLAVCAGGLVVLLRHQLRYVKAAKTSVEVRAAGLQSEVDQAVSDVRAREEEIIERLSSAAGHKDEETELHTRRVSAYSEAIALKMGLSDEASHDIRLASLMHDIGKVAIPDAILQKTGRLTTSEFAVMKTHTTVGGDILKESRSPLLQLAAEIACSHHERWDGQGYPAGLAGADIPLAGRLVALADNFDALTTTRPYKEAWTTQQAIDHIRGNSGSQFDPSCVSAFEKALPALLAIRTSLLDTPMKTAVAC